MHLKKKRTQPPETIQISVFPADFILKIAIDLGNLEKIKEALAMGADPKNTQLYEFCPIEPEVKRNLLGSEDAPLCINAFHYLMRRIQHHDIKDFAPLLDAFLDVFPELINMRNALNQTPLLIAAAVYRWDIIEHLLQKGADPTAFDKNLNNFLIIGAKSPPTPEHPFAYLSYRSASDAMLLQQSRFSKFCPLHFLAYHAQDAMLTTMLKRESAPSLLNVKTADGSTPLEVAIIRGHRSTVQLLLQLGSCLIPNPKEPLRLLKITLMLAEQDTKDFFIDFLWENIPNCQQLIADAGIPTHENRDITLFFLALTYGLEEGIKTGLDKISEEDVSNEKILSTLFSCCHKGALTRSLTSSLIIILSTRRIVKPLLAQHCADIASQFKVVTEIQQLQTACKEKHTLINFLTLATFPPFSEIIKSIDGGEIIRDFITALQKKATEAPLGLGAVDNASISRSTPTFRDMSAGSMDSADMPQSVGIELKRQQLLIEMEEAKDVLITLYSSHIFSRACIESEIKKLIKSQAKNPVQVLLRAVTKEFEKIQNDEIKALSEALQPLPVKKNVKTSPPPKVKAKSLEKRQNDEIKSKPDASQPLSVKQSVQTPLQPKVKKKKHKQKTVPPKAAALVSSDIANASSIAIAPTPSALSADEIPVTDDTPVAIEASAIVSPDESEPRALASGYSLADSHDSVGSSETTIKTTIKPDFVPDDLESVDNGSISRSTPTFRGISAESMDPADTPQGVGIELNCQQPIISGAPTADVGSDASVLSIESIPSSVSPASSMLESDSSSDAPVTVIPSSSFSIPYYKVPCLPYPYAHVVHCLLSRLYSQGGVGIVYGGLPRALFLGAPHVNDIDIECYYLSFTQLQCIIENLHPIPLGAGYYSGEFQGLKVDLRIMAVAPAGPFIIPQFVKTHWHKPVVNTMRIDTLSLFLNELGELIILDPYRGCKNLREKTLELLSPIQLSDLLENPALIFRMFRFASVGFTMDHRTLDTIHCAWFQLNFREHMGRLMALFKKHLQQDYFNPFFDYVFSTGFTRALFPNTPYEDHQYLKLKHITFKLLAHLKNTTTPVCIPFESILVALLMPFCLVNIRKKTRHTCDMIAPLILNTLTEQFSDAIHINPVHVFSWVKEYYRVWEKTQKRANRFFQPIPFQPLPNNEQASSPPLDQFGVSDPSTLTRH